MLASRISNLHFLVLTDPTMTDDEANTAFNELMQVLRDNGLGWIADQVDREITEGQLSFSPLHDEPGKKRPAKSEQYAATKPYSPQSKLQFLISVIEDTVAASAAMVDALAQFIPAEQPFTITFQGDAPTASAWQISRHAHDPTVAASETLRHLLADLRGDATPDHGDRIGTSHEP